NRSLWTQLRWLALLVYPDVVERGGPIEAPPEERAHQRNDDALGVSSDDDVDEGEQELGGILDGFGPAQNDDGARASLLDELRDVERHVDIVSKDGQPDHSLAAQEEIVDDVIEKVGACLVRFAHGAQPRGHGWIEGEGRQRRMGNVVRYGERRIERADDTRDDPRGGQHGVMQDDSHAQP